MIFLFIFLGLFLGLTLVGTNLIILIVLSIGVFFFSLKRFKRRIAISFLIAFVIGLGISFINIKINPSSGTYLGVVIETKANYYVVISKFERLIVYEDNNVREVGDIVKLTGNIIDLVDTSLESEFSFVEYLANKGIARQINVSEINVVFANFIKIKAYKNMFLNLFDPVARDYVDAFLFNVKNYESSSTILMSSLNLTFLFSSSGIYLSIIFKMVEYLLFLKLNEKHTKLGSLLILSWYFIFACNKIGVRRIFYIRFFSYINKYHLKHKFTYIEIISLVGISMLTINPYLARQSGFYLGFFISFSFFFAKNALTRGRKFRLVPKTSVFAFLFMLPIGLSDSATFHVLGIIIQLILTPYTFIFMLISLVSLYSYPIKPLFTFMANALTSLMKGLSYIDITIPFKEFSGVFVLVYYLVLFLALYFLESYSYKKVGGLVIVGLSIFTLKITPYEMLYANSISFLNVGQGDSAVIRYYDKTVMVDTGGLTYKDIATEVTIPYLHKQGINHVDYVFISHSDYDHTGALASLKEHIPVRNVIDTSEPFTVTIKDLTIKNINEWANEFSDENDKSQVLTFYVANKNIMMMGDASVNIENKIMEKYRKEDFNIDLLKVGHHGSNTSSSKAFLNFINPKEAIISVGKNNKYHHPNKEVINNLEDLKIKYYRTDEIGTVHYYAHAFLKA
ncbi:MAG: ComEC/Rec2 family competence protein [Bacilli bacterium]|nr:ComEC/Rec2 family competence protein [Bacilli bacterium]